MYNEKPYRRPYQNAMGGVATGIFIIGLAVAIFLGAISGHWFLPILFVGLAFASLIGAFSSYDHKAAYGGLQGFVWLLGLALCFAIGFWPWILLPIGFSIILGALAAPIMSGMRNTVFPSANQQYPPPYQPYQPYQPGQPYQSGQPYQPGQPLPPYQQSQPAQPYQPAEQPQAQATVTSQEGEPRHQPVQQP
jgi:hypothetical protein